MQFKEGKLLREESNDAEINVTDDPKVLQEINARLTEVVEKAPSDANVQFILRRVGQGFKGLLRIRSSRGRFVSGATGEKVVDVVNNMCREVNSQIRRWKGIRELKAADSGSAWE